MSTQRESEEGKITTILIVRLLLPYSMTGSKASVYRCQTSNAKSVVFRTEDTGLLNAAFYSKIYLGISA
jgi:hypothetical protein